jgi:transcriptional regulator with XRE-family HTH domain
MIISEEEARRRQESPDNLANRFNIHHERIEHAGRKPGQKNLPIETKDEIALRSRIGEKQAILANEFNVSQNEISEIERGNIKSINEAKVERQLGEVRDLALEKVMLSLGLITADKLSGCSAPELAHISNNLGNVVSRTIPNANQQTSVNLIVYSPEPRKESSFKVIEI